MDHSNKVWALEMQIGMILRSIGQQNEIHQSIVTDTRDARDELATLAAQAEELKSRFDELLASVASMEQMFAALGADPSRAAMMRLAAVAASVAEPEPDRAVA